MVHLRIVVPTDTAGAALELLRGSDSVVNVIHLPGVASKPDGDVVFCDVAREDASVVIDDLRELEIPRRGSIALENVEAEISDAADRAEEAARGLASDAVVWEDVEARTSEHTELSFSFVAFMVLAMLIAAVGIMLDQPILIVGAMVVGPEFGPLAAVSVAIVELRGALAKRSLVALGIGFPAGIVATLLVTLALRETGLAPEGFSTDDHPLTEFVSNPDFFSFFVAYVAGTAGILSLTSAKSGALIGVLISVTTIPAAANIGVAAAYGDWSQCGGAAGQLGINLVTIVAAGVATLYLQRRYYLRRRVKHLSDLARTDAGLPLGHSRRAGSATFEAPEMTGRPGRPKQGSDRPGRS